MANEKEAFACAVDAFSALNLETEMQEALCLSFESLFASLWKPLWNQTPEGRAVDAQTEGGDLAQPEKATFAKEDTEVLSVPEAAIAYTEKWTSAVEEV